MLSVNDVRKNYGAFQAVKGVSFAVEPGQILGLLGRNGAGKSTTMNIISGYLMPTQGEVLWRGVPIHDPRSTYREEMGYLPEIPPLYPELTVAEYLDYICGLKRIRREKKRAHIAQVCELVRIEERRRQVIRSLSKGYRQRVGLAQALIGNPTLLILDEPMVGLDPEQMASMRELIRALGRDHAVILSSHILSQAEDLCSRLVILAGGTVAASGAIGEIAASVVRPACRVRVRTRGAGVREALLAVEGVRAVQPLAPRESGFEEWQIVASRDVVQPVQACLREIGAQLRMLYPMDVELEDVFLNLTKEGAPHDERMEA